VTAPAIHTRRLSAGPFFASLLVAAAALLALTSAQASELRGRVVAIADGDTVTVLDDERAQHKVRLAGIDAPERGQSFGDASKKSLSALAFNQAVTVVWHKRDRYGRLVGVVRVQTSGTDVNLAQVAAGMAWHYSAYAGEQTAGDRDLYGSAEARARETRRGLWCDPAPVPPWEFRRAQREVHSNTSEPSPPNAD
jgi:endonuclease YncB( thermonuclease family)